MREFRKLFILFLMLSSLNLFSSDCDKLSERIKVLLPLQVRALNLGLNNISLSIFSPIETKNLRIISEKNNQDFYNTVIRIRKKEVFSHVRQHTLINYIKKYNKPLKVYSKPTTEDPTTKYNKLTGKKFKKLPREDYQGGEGKLYQIRVKESKYKNIVLKVWKPDAKWKFETSHLGLEILYNTVNDTRLPLFSISLAPITSTTSSSASLSMAYLVRSFS